MYNEMYVDKTSLIVVVKVNHNYDNIIIYYIDMTTVDVLRAQNGITNNILTIDHVCWLVVCHKTVDNLGNRKD